MPNSTARALFKLPKDGPNRRDALIWAKSYGENLLGAVQECPRGDWLIWMIARLKVEPKSLLNITYQCSLLAISELDAWGDMPFRWGLYTVEQWLAGESSFADCQDSLDSLHLFDDEIYEIPDSSNPVPLADEIVSHLLTTCIDISERSPRSYLVYDLAWTIYNAAKLQEWGEVGDLQQALAEYANFIRKILENGELLRIDAS